MAGDKWDGFVPVDWERSAGQPYKLPVARLSDRCLFYRG